MYSILEEYIKEKGFGKYFLLIEYYSLLDRRISINKDRSILFFTGLM